MKDVFLKLLRIYIFFCVFFCGPLSLVFFLAFSIVYVKTRKKKRSAEITKTEYRLCCGGSEQLCILSKWLVSHHIFSILRIFKSKSNTSHVLVFPMFPLISVGSNSRFICPVCVCMYVCVRVLLLFFFLLTISNINVEIVYVLLYLYWFFTFACLRKVVCSAEES